MYTGGVKVISWIWNYWKIRCIHKIPCILFVGIIVSSVGDVIRLSAKNTVNKTNNSQLHCNSGGTSSHTLLLTSTKLATFLIDLKLWEAGCLMCTVYLHSKETERNRTCKSSFADITDTFNCINSCRKWMCWNDPCFISRQHLSDQYNFLIKLNC